MVDSKTTALNLFTPTLTDLVYGVDDPGGTPVSGKMTIQGVFSAANLVPGSDVLEVRRGANAQSLNLYNTYTDGSNYERGFARWDSNVFEIGVAKAGTGSNRVLQISGAAHSLTFETGANSGLGMAVAGEIVAQVRRSNSNDAQFRLLSGKYGLTFGADTAAAALAGLNYEADAIVKPTNGAGGAGGLHLGEMTAPSAPSANAVRIYAEDNGAGKTRLMAIFASGAAQQIAIEP